MELDRRDMDDRWLADRAANDLYELARRRNDPDLKQVWKRLCDLIRDMPPDEERRP